MRFCWVIQIPPLHDQHLRDKPAWHSSPVRQAGAYWLSSTWGQYLTVARQTCWIRYDAAQHDTFIRWCWTWYDGASHLEHSRPKKFSLVGFDVEKLNHVSILDHTAQRLWRLLITLWNLITTSCGSQFHNSAYLVVFRYVLLLLDFRCMLCSKCYKKGGLAEKVKKSVPLLKLIHRVKLMFRIAMNGQSKLNLNCRSWWCECIICTLDNEQPLADLTSIFSSFHDEITHMKPSQQNRVRSLRRLFSSFPKLLLRCVPGWMDS